MVDFTIDDVRRQLSLLGFTDIDDVVLKRFVERISTPRPVTDDDANSTSEKASPELPRRSSLRDFLPAPRRVKKLEPNSHRQETPWAEDEQDGIEQEALHYFEREDDPESAENKSEQHVEYRQAAKTSRPAPRSSFRSSDPVALFKKFSHEWEKKTRRRRPATSMAQYQPDNWKKHTKSTSALRPSERSSTVSRDDMRVQWINRIRRAS